MTGPGVLWPYGDAAATAAAGAFLLGLVALAEALRRYGASAHATRALVHVGTGLAVAAAPFLFRTPLGPLGLALGFGAVNMWAVRTGRLAALHAANRRSWGTVAFPLALVAVVGWWAVRFLDAAPLPGEGRMLWAAPFAVLALADPSAAAVGRRWGRGDGPKTVAGSAAFFAVAFSVTFGLGLAVTPWSAGLAAFVALVVAGATTAAEAAGRDGWDNLWTVAAGVVALDAAVGWAVGPAGVVPAPDPRALAALGVGAAFGGLAWRARTLTADGALAAGLLAASIVALGTLAHAATGAAFFVGSSVLSKVGKRRAAALEAVSEKGSVRDAGQVLANGGTAWAALVLLAGSPAGLAAWAAAFAAAAADTWATEVGTLLGGRPRLVTTLRPVEKGTSGAVSAAGLAGAAAGAALIAVLAAVVPAVPVLPDGLGGSGPLRWPSADGGLTGRVALAVFAGGLAGSLFDSLLGATLQARYRTAEGHPTEKPAAPDGTPHALAGGWRWLTNDRVNLLATVAGVLAASAVELGTR